MITWELTEECAQRVHYIRTEELGENEIVPAALAQEIEEESPNDEAARLAETERVRAWGE